MSYFPCDIPFMSDEELKENGINIPKDVSNTNVGKTKYIEYQAVIDALEKVASFFPYKVPGNADTYIPYNEAWNDAIGHAEMEMETLLPADVVPVVRCENCIHWSDSNQCARPELSGSRWHDPKYFDTYPDDFCSYGEREE